MVMDFLVVHGSVRASLPEFTGRSPQLTDQPTIHYTLFSARILTGRLCFTRVLAGAVHAPVDAARPAIPGQSLSEMLASPVKPDGEIIPRYVHLCREGIRLLSFQINFVQQLPILRGHQRQKTAKALAKLALVLFAGSFRKFFFETFQGSALRPLFAVNIDN